MDFGRIITAMVTPFNEEGEIDQRRTEILVDHLMTHGTDGLIVTGTTGESPTLTFSEKVNLYKTVVNHAKGKIPIIAGTGTNNTRESIELTKEAERIGVDGIMLVVPYYNKPSQRGLYEHFKQIAQSTTLPIMLYNIPGRSAINMEIETIIELAKIDNIVSLKDATGNLQAMTQIISRTPDSFTVYSGDDQLTLPVLAIGGHGIVSVSSHVIGEPMQQMINHYLSGNIKQAAHIHQQLLPIMNELFAHPSPAPVKAALNMQDIQVGRLRLPLVDLTEEEKKQLHAIISKQLMNI
ncbi:MAG TPA: 4-hydroxy-tetrahydrodipicolinate synthase [Bacillota bacterium]|nr:4-hydroxy-tetrahydrodipicolinate synthase [Bacillota bacterium]